jgi:hypothetical protein
MVENQREIVLIISPSTAENPGPDFHDRFAYFQQEIENRKLAKTKIG